MIEYTQSYNISLDRGAENKSITILVWQTFKIVRKGILPKWKRISHSLLLGI
jgi:hypothetical protein